MATVSFPFPFGLYTVFSPGVCPEKLTREKARYLFLSAAVYLDIHRCPLYLKAAPLSTTWWMRPVEGQTLPDKDVSC